MVMDRNRICPVFIFANVRCAGEQNLEAVSQLNDFNNMAAALAINPVDLPLVNGIIHRPPSPQNPPVARDVIAGHRYQKDVFIAHSMRNQHDSCYHEYLQLFWSVEEGRIGDIPFADSFTYQLNLVQARAGAGVFNSLADVHHP